MECLRLTAARASDLYFSHSLSGLGRSVSPVIKFYFFLIKWVSFLALTVTFLLISLPLLSLIWGGPQALAYANPTELQIHVM